MTAAVQFITTDLIQSHGQTITSRRDEMKAAYVRGMKMPAPSALAVHALLLYVQGHGLSMSEPEAAELVNRVLAAEEIGRGR